MPMWRERPVPANIYDLVYLMTMNPLAYVRDVVAMITALVALLYSRADLIVHVLRFGGGDHERKPTVARRGIQHPAHVQHLIKASHTGRHRLVVRLFRADRQYLLVDGLPVDPFIPGIESRRPYR